MALIFVPQLNLLYLFPAIPFDGSYETFYFGESLSPDQVEISEEVFIITGEEARKQTEPPRLTKILVLPEKIKVLSGFANEQGLTLNVEILQENGISAQKIEETKMALKNLELNDEMLKSDLS
ncbi:hypothetical protein [Desulfonema magnum]|uniref:Uncharacterized protein n=1 Tax=Desulfonema magnum TaxID=45655 RepID=A0A975BQV5_9BACT|nr:hypothetical protein [Desulfonema magnum]QTA89529.1 Uncharacterized protein dnm_055850 [Desulfonema magnum]